MRDPSDDEDIDRAYRAAVDAASDETDLVAAHRRRRAVLDAVLAASPQVGRGSAAQQPASPAVAGGRPASNQPVWRLPAAWWRGAAAACVIVSSALVVSHLREEAGTGLEVHEPTAASKTAADEARAPVAVQGSAQRATVAPAPEPTPAPTLTRTRPPKPAGLATMARAPTQPLASIAPAAPAAAGQLQAAPPSASPPPATAVAAITATESTQQSRVRVARPAAPEAAVAAAADRVVATQALAGAGAKAERLTARQSLLAAVAAGDASAAELILASSNADAETDADGRTALALAVLNMDARLVKLLLARGANRLAPDRFGQTPQGYAQAGGNTAVLRAFGLP
jgi:hypothetical protein